MEPRIVSVRTYLIVFVALLALTFATYEAALANLGGWNVVIAFGIAIVKAILILLFFMHAIHSKGVTRIAIGAGLLWLGILMAGAMDDLVTRGWLGIPGK